MSDHSSDFYIEERLTTLQPDFSIVENFVDRDARGAFRTLFSVWTELREPLYGRADPEAVLARLGWWREEWARMIDGQARHPLSRRLGESASFRDQDIDAGLLAVAELVGMESCSQWSELTAPAEKLAGAMGLLEGRLLGGEVERLREIWCDIVSADLILNLPALIEAGRAMMPLDLSAELQITGEDLRESPADRARLVGKLAEMRTRRASGPVPSAFGWIYLQMLERRLAGIRRRARETGLLGRLWAAWRGAREVRSV